MLEGKLIIIPALCCNEFMPLIYNSKQGKNFANHLVSIMNIGNQLYSSTIIHERQLRNCVITTVTIAVWQSSKDNSRCVILKARVHAAMRLV